MTTFINIATRLGDFYKTRRSIQIKLSHAEEDHLARAIAITPAEGWAGKNAEQRESERDRAFAADETLKKIAAIQRDLRDQLSALEGEIDALEEMRDGAKWVVRQSLAESMNGKAIAFNEHSVVEDAAADSLEAQAFGAERAPLEVKGNIFGVGHKAEEDIPF